MLWNNFSLLGREQALYWHGSLVTLFSHTRPVVTCRHGHVPRPSPFRSVCSPAAKEIHRKATLRRNNHNERNTNGEANTFKLSLIPQKTNFFFIPRTETLRTPKLIPRYAVFRILNLLQPRRNVFLLQVVMFYACSCHNIRKMNVEKESKKRILWSGIWKLFSWGEKNSMQNKKYVRQRTS